MAERVLLAVLADLPVPPTSGLHLRLLGNIAVARRLGWTVDAVYFADDERAALTVEGPWRYAVALRRPDYAAFTTRARVIQRLRFLAAALARRPGRSYPFSVAHDAAGGKSAVLGQLERSGASTVLLPSILLHYAPQVVAAGATVIADAADVLTTVTRQSLTVYGRRSPHKLPGFLVNHLAIRSQERLFLRACAEVWATSAPEAAALQRLAPDANVLVLPNVIDEASIGPRPLPAADSIGFIGNYAFETNRDAAEFLIRDVFPRVRAAVPAARLRLAGTGLPAATAASEPGVELLGFVESSVDFFSECTVAPLPIRVRAGVPLKLVEALACGRPVVATPELVAGLPLVDGRDLLVAGDAAATADAIVDLLRDRERARAVGAAGREAFLRHFSLAAAVAEAARRSILSAQRGTATTTG